MPSAGLEPAIPETKRLQTYALGSNVTGINQKLHTTLVEEKTAL